MVSYFSAVFLFATFLALSAAQTTIIKGICPGRDPPLATVGNSCGVADFVNIIEFGDNMDTTGRLRVDPIEGGLKLKINVNNLPKPDLVLTAWLVWVPFGVTDPPIFEVRLQANETTLS